MNRTAIESARPRFFLSELFAQPIDAALEDAEVELQAPARLLEARQGGPVLRQLGALAIELEGLANGLRRLAAPQAALDLRGEQGDGRFLSGDPAAHRLALGLGALQR